MSLNWSSLSAENDKPIQPKVRIKKKNYDATKKFQEKWATKLPWAKLFIGEDGPYALSIARFEVEGKNKIVKWNSLCKHASH